MSIVNRRNAVLGWLTWLGVKSIAKSKAKSTVPAVKDKPAKAAAGAAAAVGGLVLFKRLRRRRSAVSETEGLRDSE